MEPISELLMDYFESVRLEKNYIKLLWETLEKVEVSDKFIQKMASILPLFMIEKRLKFQ